MGLPAPTTWTAQEGSPLPAEAISNIGQVGGQEDQSSRNFAQRIDDVYVYQTALTANQVQQLYTMSPFGPTAASLPMGTAVSIAGGAQLDLNGANAVIGSLSGSGGTVTNSATGISVTLTISPSGGSTSAFSGTIQDGAGTTSLLISGNGTQILAGSNTYTGGTTISGGTLQLGDGVSNNGYLQGNVTDNSALVFANPLAQTFSGQISGSGGVTMAGSNTLTLSGSNTFSGVTRINTGTLALGNSSTLGQSTLDTGGSGSMSFGTLTAATFGGLQGTSGLVLANNAPRRQSPLASAATTPIPRSAARSAVAAASLRPARAC